MKAFLLYALSLVAFCATGAVGCHAKLTNWDKHVRVHHRILDPAALYWQPEIDGVELPDTKTCMERAGIAGDVAHTAVEDARLVARLIRRHVTG